MEYLTEQASQIIGCLSGNVVEIDTVADAVHDGEKQSCQGNNLVEGHGCIEGDVLLEGGLSEEGDEVSCHGQK